MSKDEFVEIGLELGFAYPMIGFDQPLLKIADTRSARGTADLAPFRNSERTGWLRAICL